MAPRDRQSATEQTPAPARRAPAPRPPVGATVASLHQAIGNRAIAQMVSRRAKGKPFYQEVLDAIADEKRRGFRIPITDKVKGSLVAFGLPRLYRLLRVCRAVEAEDADETRKAAADLLGHDDVRPWVSEDLANELISRTQLMGLQTESDRLKTWLREHTDEPLSKGTFRADRDLWEMTSARALDRARKPPKDPSNLDDLDLLLRIFKRTFHEAAKLDADKLRVDREIR